MTAKKDWHWVEDDDDESERMMAGTHDGRTTENNPLSNESGVDDTYVNEKESSGKDESESSKNSAGQSPSRGFFSDIEAEFLDSNEETLEESVDDDGFDVEYNNTTESFSGENAEGRQVKGFFDDILEEKSVMEQEQRAHLKVGIESQESIHSHLADYIEDVLTQEDYDYAKEKWQKENDKLTDTPVDNPEVRGVVIGNNGETLVDFLRNRRTGRGRKKKISKEELAKKALEVTKEGEWKNEAYVKRVKQERLQNESIKKIRAKNKGCSSNSFLKLHSEPSKYEKQIIKSLGVSMEELHTLIAPSSPLSDDKKAKLMSAGYFGDRDSGSGRYSTFLSLRDLHPLQFLEKFKLATNGILSLAIGKSYESARGQMNKLKHMGLVVSIPVIGTNSVWALTKSGLVAIGSDDGLVPKGQGRPGALAERLFVNHIAACLYSNRVNALNLEDYPFNGRMFDGQLVKGEEIIPEHFLTSSMMKKVSEITGGAFVKSKYRGERYDLLKEAWEIEWRKWENSGRVGDSPETIIGNEYLYILFDDNDLTNKYLLPDLVVKRDRLPDGSPQSIAIEAEKTVRNEDYYMKKLMAYKMDSRVYSKVIYITPYKRAATIIAEAAAKINFDRFDVVPLLDINGPTRKIGGWVL